jgi:catecholate siderophore receptor
MRLRLNLNYVLAGAILCAFPALGDDARPEAPAPVSETITVEAPSGYRAATSSSAMKTEAPLREIPQSISVVTRDRMQDQLMASIGDVVRYIPGVTQHQGENNRDQLVMRGNSSSADFFLDGVRDDVQYYRDLYNLERVEVLKGPNALIFGRGGAGGVVNRVTKMAGFTALREVDVNAGTFGNKRVAADIDEPIGERAAFRINAIGENSDSFRNFVSLKRTGIAPSFTWMASDATMVSLGYERFQDRRVADRGITSYLGEPAGVDVNTYYGNPQDSHVRADVNIGTAVVEHHAGALTIRNRTLFGAYDRGYQNYVPGAVAADRSTVVLSAYNNATERENLFNQLDFSGSFTTGALRHSALAGIELGRQQTDNFRNTGYFNNQSTSINVPFASTTITTPVTFRQSATDADNHVSTQVAAAYVQDQLDLSKRWKAVGGLRFDRFQLDFLNHRNGDRLERNDDMVSPRAGLIFTPAASISLYSSYSVSYLPSSGDQFSSLTSITQQLKPEQFTNKEIGVKWDAPRGLSITTAIYQLDRTNTRSTDPNDPTRAIQTGSQRTNGAELTVEGNVASRWSVAGGYAYQDAFVTSATASAKEGAQVAQVPRRMISLWNRCAINATVGIAVGVVHRASMFAAIDNTVILPAYTELDGAAYYTFRPGIRLQLNVENLLNTVYYANADNNTNITPGSPRAVRLGLTTRF